MLLRSIDGLPDAVRPNFMVQSSGGGLWFEREYTTALRTAITIAALIPSLILCELSISDIPGELLYRA